MYHKQSTPGGGIAPLFSRRGAEIGRKSSVRSLADEQGVAADVAAELGRGKPVVEGHQHRRTSAGPEAVHSGAGMDRPRPRQPPAARSRRGGLRRARGSAAALNASFASGAAMTRHLGLTAP